MNFKSSSRSGRQNGPSAVDLRIVLGLLALALVLRVYDLTGESLWFDEAYAVWSSAMDIASPRVLWEWQIEFPLYHLLLHFWMRLFGQGDLAVRAFGALAGTLTVVPMYSWGKGLFGRRTGALGALLLAVNPFHIWYSQEVRMYAWALLFTVASLHAFWRMVNEGTWRWVLAHLMLTGLAFHLHYYIAWVVLAEDFFYLLRLWRLRGGSLKRNTRARLPASADRNCRQAATRWLLGQLGVLILALPAFGVFQTKLVTFNQWGWLSQRYGAPGLGDVLGLFFTYTMGLAFPGPSGLRWVVLGVFLALASWGIMRAAQFPYPGLSSQPEQTERREALGLTVLAVGLPLALVFVSGQFVSTWVPRYLLLFLPPFLLLVAAGVDRMGPKLGAGVTVLLLAASLYSLTGMYGVQQKEDWRGVAAYLDAHAGQDDLVVLMDEECRVPLDYYYHSDSPRLEVSRFADGATLDSVVARIWSDKRGGHLWLVVSHADSEGLEARLNALPDLRAVGGPEFVGIKLARYAWS